MTCEFPRHGESNFRRAGVRVYCSPQRAQRSAEAFGHSGKLNVTAFAPGVSSCTHERRVGQLGPNLPAARFSDTLAS